MNRFGSFHQKWYVLAATISAMLLLFLLIGGLQYAKSRTSERDATKSVGMSAPSLPSSNTPTPNASILCEVCVEPAQETAHAQPDSASDGAHPSMEAVLRSVPTSPGIEWGNIFCQQEYSSSCAANHSNPEQPEKVAASYKASLPQQGWLLINEKVFEEGAPQYRGADLQFARRSNSSDMPSRVNAHIMINTDRQGQVVFGSYVSIWVTSWPDPNNPPLYPKATRLESRWLKNDFSGYPERVIAYIAPANKAEVLDFYRHNAVRDGWDVDSSNESQIVFTFAGGPPKAEGAVLTVDVVQVGSNQTEVQLTVHGDEVTLTAVDGEK